MATSYCFRSTSLRSFLFKNLGLKVGMITSKCFKLFIKYFCKPHKSSGKGNVKSYEIINMKLLKSDFPLVLREFILK